MKELICKMCGSQEIVKAEDLYVCEACGTKYTTEEAEKMSVEVLLKNDNSQKIEALLRAAKRARDMNNWESAVKYYDEILALDPDNWQAVFYSAYSSARNCKIAHISSACQLVINSYQPTFTIIKESMSVERQQAVLTIMAFDICEIAQMMYLASVNHYNGIDDSIKYNYSNEVRTRCTYAANIAFVFGDLIKEFFGSEHLDSRVMAYKSGLKLFDAGYCSHNMNYIDGILDVVREQDNAFVENYIETRKNRQAAFNAKNQNNGLICLIIGVVCTILGLFIVVDSEIWHWFLIVYGIMMIVFGGLTYWAFKKPTQKK